MDEPVEVLSPARYQQLRAEQKRLRSINGFRSIEEALESLANIIGSDEEIDEFVRTIHRWRGHEPDCMAE
jgi:hypothetical protein